MAQTDGVVGPGPVLAVLEPELPRLLQRVDPGRPRSAFTAEAQRAGQGRIEGVDPGVARPVSEGQLQVVDRLSEAPLLAGDQPTLVMEEGQAHGIALVAGGPQRVDPAPVAHSAQHAPVIRERIEGLGLQRLAQGVHIGPGGLVRRLLQAVAQGRLQGVGRLDVVAKEPVGPDSSRRGPRRTWNRSPSPPQARWRRCGSPSSSEGHSRPGSARSPPGAVPRRSPPRRGRRSRGPRRGRAPGYGGICSRSSSTVPCSGWVGWEQQADST